MEGNREDDQVSIPVQLLTASILGEFKPVKSLSLCHIFKFPQNLRGASKTWYEPQVVSIGPYHHGKESLKAFETYKIKYLHFLLRRTSRPEPVLEQFVKAITKLEAQARECYEGEIALSSHDFVRMMIIDGAFLLELFLRYVGSPTAMHQPISETWMESNLTVGDPVFSTTWMEASIMHDLFLVENQLPRIVLQCLYDLTRNQHRCSLEKYFSIFFSDTSPMSPELRKRKGFEFKGEHALDYLRKQHLPPSQEDAPDYSPNQRLPPIGQTEYDNYHVWEFSHCATDLWEAGVKFRKKETANSLLEITFTKGVLEIPPFSCTVSSSTLLLNFIALEQCRGDYTDQFTSYLLFLDTLINSEHDVKLLRHAGIILGNNEDETVHACMNNVSKISRILSTGINIDKFHYGEVSSRLNAYSRANWHKWRAILRHNYFSTPWKVLSLVTALILLLLTFEQSVFSILSYARQVGEQKNKHS